jgi:uncharacterized protein with FMN-binding domain
MSHKKAITKAVIFFAAALLAVSFPLTALAEPEYSTDGTCVGPGCHTEDELPSLVGHSGGAQQATEAPEIAQIEGAEYFTASSKGFGGEVEVTIAVKDGKIAAMVAYGPKETSGIGSNAIDQLPDAVVSAQTWEVDAVAGASVSSKAVKEATKAAMIQAGLIEGEAATPTPAAQTPAPTQAPAAEGAEHYTASSKGFGGDVEVTIAVKDGKIVEVSVSGPNETSGIGSNAIDRLPGEIVSAQSWEVEAVSGATMTSMAIREAAKAAMAEAGLIGDESAAPAPATETPEAPEAAEPEGGMDMVIIVIAIIFVVVAGGIIFFSHRRKD